MKNGFQSNEDLIKMLLFIRNKELDKPSDEMDDDLITACTEALLDLQNKEVTLSPEEIEERVKKIPFVETTDAKTVKAKPQTTKKRILLIAAIITVLFVILSLPSTATTDWDLYALLLSEKFGSVADAPEGVTFYENGTSYGVYGPAKIYASIDELMESENPDILLPTDSSDTLTIKDIMVAQESGYKLINIRFKEGLSYTVYKNAPIPQSIFDNVKPVTIGNTAVYIEDLADVNHYQVYFSYKGDYYCIIHSEKEPVHEILNELEPYL